ncbi:N-acetylmuramoyl-L-alanine amidase [Streptomyces sp. NPDC005576]|uniref:N-acetylmuramoyl-L-alanine amidase n=1 Tax=unclassified Streptomyces TaxID=2593676 RepID=UPI0033DD159B
MPQDVEGRQKVMTKNRVWGTAAAVVAGIIGVAVFQGVSNDASAGHSDSAAKPVTGPVHTNVHSSELTVKGNRADVPERDTDPFSLIGLSWTKPADELPGSVEVRARRATDSKWGEWISLKADGDDSRQEESTRGATEPVWVGASNGVQVRVDGKGAGLPAGLRLDMVDPGQGTATLPAENAAYVMDDEPSITPSATDSTAPADATPDPSITPSESATPSVSATPSPSVPASPSATPSVTKSPTPTASPSSTLPPAPTSTAPRPTILTRAQWGADESLNDEAPEYGTEIKVVFVHHTVDANTYSCTESAAMVRAIRTYHMGQGWKDIGYNFLVDKCGTIFEGRKGGVDRPVIGAQALGFNTNTTGIAVLGEYSSIDASAAAKTSIARIAAWKLGQYHADPAGKVDLTAGLDNGKFKLGQTASFNRISGHRDSYATECPGNKLYTSLAGIRSLAAGPVTGLTLQPFTGAATSGTTAYTKGAVTAHWSLSTPTAFVNRYDVIVDGKVTATAGPTATSAPLTLTPGTHSVAVRAVHVSGKIAVTANATVIADTTAPSFTTKPSLALRTGTVNTTAVPVTLGWKAGDSTALKEVRLTAPSAHTYGPTTISAALTSKSGTSTTWSLSAYDQAGNTSAASVAATSTILQETSASRTGTWTTKASGSYLGGKSYSSSSKNASLTWKFTGRSAAWVVSRAGTSGQAYVYVDGVKTSTVDLKSTTTKYRDVQWTKTWPTSGTHTIKIVVVGTSGRPAITTDGLVYLK